MTFEATAKPSCPSAACCTPASTTATFPTGAPRRGPLGDGEHVVDLERDEQPGGRPAHLCGNGLVAVGDFSSVGTTHELHAVAIFP